MRKDKSDASVSFEVPDALKDLELYRADSRLCRNWDLLFKAWSLAYPGIDCLQEVKAAHAWEVSNPEKRKKNRPRFLDRWLSRAQDKPHKLGHHGDSSLGDSEGRLEAVRKKRFQERMTQKQNGVPPPPDFFEKFKALKDNFILTSAISLDAEVPQMIKLVCKLPLIAFVAVAETVALAIAVVTETMTGSSSMAKVVYKLDDLGSRLIGKG